MPPPLILDPASVDLDRVLHSRADIYRRLPQRSEFEMLDAICFHDTEKRIAAAVRDVKADDWWARGHIPGRPIFPGVLMLEAAAQLSAYSCKYIEGFEGMVAYGGVDGCKFRATVTPPCRLLLCCRELDNRTRRIICDTQGFVGQTLVFEARITGLVMPAEGTRPPVR